MHLHREVDCYFYKGHPDLTRPTFLEDKTLWIKINENLETVYEKTLRAFEYFTPELEKYDFVYRSNLSTFVSFEHLVEYCKDLPRTRCCAAVAGGIPPEDENRNSLEQGFSFPGGNGFILSPDVVRRLVQERIPLVEQDDVTIGIALRKWGIKITEFARPDLIDGLNGKWFVNNPHLLNSKTEWSIKPKKMMFSYRIKTSDRNYDANTMDALIRTTYGV